jgi:Uncharacterised protein family UPF0564
MSIALTK